MLDVNDKNRPSVKELLTIPQIDLRVKERKLREHH